MKTTRIYYDTEFLEGTQTIYSWFGLKTDTWLRFFGAVFFLVATLFAFFFGWSSLLSSIILILLIIGSMFFIGLSMPSTPPTIDLISIGMVNQLGEEYYAISKDFNLKEAWNRYDIKIEVMSGDARNLFPNGKKTKVYWIRENVLKPIWKDMVKQHNEKVSRLSLTINHKDERLFTYKNMKSLIKSYGKSNKEIASEVIQFCSTEEVVIGNPYDLIVRTKRIKHNKEIEIYGYYSAYDHVALCWLFGKMIDLPPGMPMYTRDLKQIFDQEQDRMFNIAEKKVEEIINHNNTKGIMFFNADEYNLKKHPAYPKQSNEHSAIHDARFNKQLHEFLNNL